MIKCRRRHATDPQKFKKIVNGRFFVFCWWKRKRKRLKNNRFHILARHTVERRISDANMVIESLLHSDFQACEYFSVALDKSCDIQDKPQLATFA